MFEDYILIQKIKKWRPKCVERVIEKYYHSIYFYLCTHSYGNVQLAADLTQDIFLKGDRKYQKLSFYRGNLQLSLHNCCSSLQ